MLGPLVRRLDGLLSSSHATLVNDGPGAPLSTVNVPPAPPFAVRSLSSHDRWTLSSVEPLPGLSYLQHVEALLPACGRGPLPDAGEPLPDRPVRDPTKLQWGGGSLDGVMSLRGGPAESDAPALAAAAITTLLAAWPADESVLSVCRLLDALAGPHDVDRLLTDLPVVGMAGRRRRADLARWLCTHGTTRGVVKAGIAMLGVSGTAADAPLLARLGLVEELTLYVLVAFQNLLDDPEPWIFDLAQQVRNWGRIHAVLRLKATTNPETQNWLLREGYRNGVMFEETAFVAATAGRLADALTGEVDPALLDHAGDLLGALAMGGPAEDMSDYPDGAAALGAYLRWVEAAAPTVRCLRCLIGLEAYLQGVAETNPYLTAQQHSQLRLTCTSVLNRSPWVALVAAELHCDDWDRVAQVVGAGWRFDLPVQAVLMSWLPRVPHSGYLWGVLVRNADRDGIVELVAQAATLLPLDAVRAGASNDLGFGAEYAADHCLQQLLQGLRDHPGVGWQAVEAGLHNRVVGVRNCALSVLEIWPRDTWPPAASETLRAMLWKEPNANVRTRIRALGRNGQGSHSQT